MGHPHRWSGGCLGMTNQERVPAVLNFEQADLLKSCVVPLA